MRRKRPGMRRKKLDTRTIKKRLAGVESKVRQLAEDPEAEITEEHLEAARDIATELQEMNRQFKDALKRAMMADGKIKPGETLEAGGRNVSLVLRPGRPSGSSEPDDYDLVVECISRN